MECKNICVCVCLCIYVTYKAEPTVKKCYISPICPPLILDSTSIIWN